MAVAKRYQIWGLSKVAQNSVLAKLNTSTAVGNYNLAADGLLCTLARKRVKRFLLQNFKSVSENTPDMFGAAEAILPEILQDDALNTTEENLFSTMDGWAGSDVGRQAKLAGMMKHVRFTLM
jgi:hypothetical protein